MTNQNPQLSNQASNETTEEADRTICFCHNVSLHTLRTAIRNGADTIDKIKAETCASTGCGGCEWDVTEILEEELKKR